MPAHLQWWNTLEAIGIFALWAVGLTMVINTAWWRKGNGDSIPEKEVQPGPIGIVDEYPEGLAEAHGQVTLGVKLFIALWVIWTVGYVAIYFLRQG